MRIGIIESDQGFALYLREMLRVWGLANVAVVSAAQVESLDPRDTPVLLCPAGDIVDGHTAAIVRYVQRGGAAIACLPGRALAEACGVQRTGALDTPLRLRLSQIVGVGVAGELLPVVGRSARYEVNDPSRVLAFFSQPGKPDDVGPAIIDMPLGQGRIILLAFDLPLSVQRCRQGDPSKAQKIPTHLPSSDQGFRPGYMASDLGGDDASWLPHADLMARLLVELVRMCAPGPLPMLWHLPAGAPAMVLYTGDEDNAPLDHTRQQMQSIQQVGGQMNLYIIPEFTPSTLDHGREYLKHHRIGPHPNLRHLDHAPAQVQLDEFTRQVKLFEQIFETRARTVRNHCVVWVGYTELAERMQQLGIRMEGNFNYGSYARSRDTAPYAGWGAAMPMRFCRTDGQLVDVRQQHTHLGDDETFCDIPSVRYSFRFSPEVYAAMLDRILGDSVQRFHVPYTVNIHPGNWGRFSAPHSQALLAQCQARQLPVLSFDQWSDFCDQREAWELSEWNWQGSQLQFCWRGSASGASLHGLLPWRWNSGQLTSLDLNGKRVHVQPTNRHGQAAAVFAFPPETDQVHGQAVYA